MKLLARYSGIVALVVLTLLLSTGLEARDLDQDEALRRDDLPRGGPAGSEQAGGQHEESDVHVGADGLTARW